METLEFLTIEDITGYHSQTYEKLYNRINPRPVEQIGLESMCNLLECTQVPKETLLSIVKMCSFGTDMLDKKKVMMVMKLLALYQNEGSCDFENIQKLAPIPRFHPEIDFREDLKWKKFLSENESAFRTEYKTLFNVKLISFDAIRKVYPMVQVPIKVFAQMSNRIDLDQDGMLNIDEYVVLRVLINNYQMYRSVPFILPQSLLLMVNIECSPSKRLDSVTIRSFSPVDVHEIPLRTFQRSHSFGKSDVEDRRVHVSMGEECKLKDPFEVSCPSRKVENSNMNFFHPSSPITNQELDQVAYSFNALNTNFTTPSKPENVANILASPIFNFEAYSQSPDSARNLFNQLDYQKSGFVSGSILRDLFMKSNLSVLELSKIWDECDLQKKGSLDFDGFYRALQFITSPGGMGIYFPPDLQPGPEHQKAIQEIIDLQNEKISTLKAIEGKKKNIHALKIEAEKANSEREAMSRRTKAMMEQKEKLKMQLAEVQKQKDAMSAKVDQARICMEGEKSKLANIKMSCAAQENDMNKMKVELHQMEEILRQSSKTKDQLNVQYNELSFQLEQVNQNITNVQQKIDFMYQEVARMRERAYTEGWLKMPVPESTQTEGQPTESAGIAIEAGSAQDPFKEADHIFGKDTQPTELGDFPSETSTIQPGTIEPRSEQPPSAAFADFSFPVSTTAENTEFGTNDDATPDLNSGFVQFGENADFSTQTNTTAATSSNTFGETKSLDFEDPFKME